MEINFGLEKDMPSASQKSDKRYPSLDGLRFLLAFWVAMSHFGVFPLFAGADTSRKASWLLVHGWDSLFYGLPAVIVFFVISGFCIHLPFRNCEALSIGKYYARRYTRILVPVIGALAVYRSVGQKMHLWGEHSILWESVLWSLLCEEIYYFVYPFLLHFRRKFGWVSIIAPAMLLSIILAATRFSAESFHDLGPLKTAAVLYPAWLLGCVLAEGAEQLSASSSRTKIVAWRFLAWFGCWAVCMLHFHSPLKYTQTCMWFGVLAFYWIKHEIAYAKTYSPPKWMVWAGAWSYSLYLMHAPALATVQRFHLVILGPLVDWIAVMAFVCVYSYIFYLVIERPSHQFSRRIDIRSSANSKQQLTDPGVSGSPIY